VVLRGYGADEPLVHRRLNPTAIVIAEADRIQGVVLAKVAGADCVILDDAYQHRRIRRRENWLLVAAEQWRSHLRCLPAGPLREPLSGVDRATLIVVTRKSATQDAAAAVAERLATVARGVAVAQLHLAPGALVNALDGTSRPVDTLRGVTSLAIAAIGNPAAFFAQLRDAGASVEGAAFPDHHAFAAADVEELARRGASSDVVLCTLKDAVKLAPLWPRKGPGLWYVSQGAEVEYGGAALDASLNTILAARASVPPTAGTAGPQIPAHGYRSSTADQ
jgi:tetraacyldisaccharide 4'-kinase